jgi:hypothetical protein
MNKFLATLDYKRKFATIFRRKPTLLKFKYRLNLSIDLSIATKKIELVLNFNDCKLKYRIKYLKKK